MTSYSENAANKALQEYLEAEDNYHRLLDKYFPLRRVIPGVPITTGEPFTKAALGAALEELEKAETRVSEARKKWNRLLGL